MSGSQPTGEQVALICWRCGMRPSVRRAGLPKAKPGADAGPAAEHSGAALILIHGRIRPWGHVWVIRMPF